MIDQPPVAAGRKVSILLGIGIFLLPIVFAWFLLRKGHSTLSRVLGFGWLGLIILIWMSGLNTPASAPTTVPTPAARPGEDTPRAAAGRVAAAPPAVQTRWRYDETHDEMRGTTAKYASVVSDNELDFDFPYGRGNSTTLTVRKDGQTNVYLTIEKGQFLCNGFTDDSYVSVKFDKGPIQRFSCASSSDGSADVAFIRNASRFITALKSADKVMIEAEFYQSGRRQIIFSTHGLEWN